MEHKSKRALDVERTVRRLRRLGKMPSLFDYKPDMEKLVLLESRYDRVMTTRFDNIDRPGIVLMCDSIAEILAQRIRNVIVTHIYEQ